VSTTLLRDEADKVIGAVEFFTDLTEMEHLKNRVDRHSAFNDIVSSSLVMRRIIETLPDIAESECNVLVRGPSGSGKELIAEAIHSASPRRYGPYVKLNCAALPATLLESELFGYVKGAFTDAKRDKPGHFCFANGGTLLLDEIAEMDIALQVKLLRVLNNGEYQPLGSNNTLKADARIIAATNANLTEAIKEGRFREDLYFRLNVVEIELPALHQRPEDIPILVDHFIKRFVTKSSRPIRGISAEALAVLRRYAFPGNVRELENAIEHAFVMCHDQQIEVKHLPTNIVEQAELGRGQVLDAKSEKQIIEESLLRHHGNRSLAAKELGMHRSTLWRKLKSLCIAC
jgi:transcriptional regulator with PAS, ATPase and Fis domain